MFILSYKKVKHDIAEKYAGVEVKIQAFLISVLEKSE
jgi:hypothetical protein